MSHALTSSNIALPQLRLSGHLLTLVYASKSFADPWDDVACYAILCHVGFMYFEDEVQKGFYMKSLVRLAV